MTLESVLSSTEARASVIFLRLPRGLPWLATPFLTVFSLFTYSDSFLPVFRWVPVTYI
jgi:hypothetical protein